MMDLGLPELASAHGAQLDHATVLVHWLMLLLFVGWMGFFLLALFKFRAGANPKADYVGVTSHVSSWLEVAVAVAEVVILVGFSIPLWSMRVDDTPPEDEAVVVRVIAQQFAWNVHYPGEDGVFGPTSVNLVDEESNPIGLDRDAPAGADDIVTLNWLHLPVDQPVIVKLSSKDVIHSFGLQEMRVKQDAIPGIEIPLWFTPTVTTEEMAERMGNPEYNYEISCAQLCGIGHGTMRGFMKIHDQEGYDAFLAEEASYLGGGDDFWG